jgi:dihydrofolate reductase
MIISFVVAASENNVIGKDNQLLWHLPNDMKFFKNTTWGMPVVMGRKTFDSIKRKPLGGRVNIVITSHTGIKAEGEGRMQVAVSPEQAMEQAAQTDCKETFIIGGGEIYKAFMPMVNRIYLTRVHATLEGDTFLPTMQAGEWDMKYSHDFPADEKHAYPYSFQLWERNAERSPGINS